MLYFLNFSSFEFNRNEGFCGFHELSNLNVLIVVIYNIFEQFYNSSWMDQFVRHIFILSRHIFFNLLQSNFVLFFRQRFENIALFDVSNNLDWIYKFQDERSASFEHSHIDILSSSWMKLHFNFLFRFSRIKQMKYLVLNLFLETTICELFAVYNPWSLR